MDVMPESHIMFGAERQGEGDALPRALLSLFLVPARVGAPSERRRRSMFYVTGSQLPPQAQLFQIQACCSSTCGHLV